MLEVQKGLIEAENILEELGFDQLPINPFDVVDAISTPNFKVIMETHDFSSLEILGKAQGNDSAALIYINKNIPDKGRSNFTAAHEVGHVCMHIMPQKKLLFECGNNELSNSFNDPIELQANGFASGLLMPKNLIKPLSNSDLNWVEIQKISNACSTSLEATFRRLLLMIKEPYALVIHQNGKFQRYVPSENFNFYIQKYPLSSAQKDLIIDVKEEAYPFDFDEVDPCEWVNPESRGYILESIYISSILLNAGITYTLIKYDEDSVVEK
ncbi:MAG: ImmA/IrrE family metallo-endopeptidase [Methylophilus sp.]|nr:ImmA/IrrE family metallo-endopeptidase [Methylophilus sp.]